VVTVVQTAEYQDMIKRIDSPDFNLKDLEKLKDIYRRDTYYFVQHPFYGAIFGKLIEWAECYFLMKNVQGESK